MTNALASALNSLAVDNVYVYVADALRWDYLSTTIADRGAVSKTVAASIHSPTSFASLVTGRYLPSHGVTEFSRRVPSSMATLFDLVGGNTRFVNTIGVAGADDPIFSVLEIESNELSHPFDGLAEPFVTMERGQGGHAPYGDFDGTAKEYFAARRDDTVEHLSEEYRRGVERDAEHFLDRLNALETEGLLDRTLVIYTSDHGELLGEGGMFGHNGPIRPEHVYVPTVFLHPSIEPQQVESLFRHVDLLPTITDVLDEPMSADASDGRSIGATERGEHATVGCSFYHKEHALGPLSSTPATSYASAWDASGGHVFARSPRYERLVGLAGSLTAGVERPFARRRLPAALRSYVRNETTYGTPRVSVGEARQTISRVTKGNRIEGGDAVELSRDAKDHLRDMGYLE